MATSEEMLFNEYEKMTTNMSKFEPSKEFNKVQWMVTEKIHGANFSFHTDGQTVRVARRRDFLAVGENFYNYLTANFIQTHSDKMTDVFNDVQKSIADDKVVQISVYGELFGGTYVVEGKDMKTSNQNPIQREIQYCPNIDWMAFDISYLTSQDLSENRNKYVDPERAMQIFQDNDINYIKPLFIGKMNEALTYELGFDSTIPNYYSLPRLPKGSNTAEGIVVKPIKTIKMKTKKNDIERVIVKIKHPDFDETRKACNLKKPKIQNQNKKKDMPLISKIACYATEERLVSALTKVGELNNSETEERAKKELYEDIFKDIAEFDEGLYKQWKQSSDSEKMKNKKILIAKIEKLINKYKNNYNS